MRNITKDLFKKLLIYSIIPFIMLVIIFSLIMRSNIYENVNRTARHHLISIYNRLMEEINLYNYRIPQRIVYSIIKHHDLKDELKYFIYKTKGLYDIYIIDESGKIIIGESKFYNITQGEKLKITSDKFQHEDNDILITNSYILPDKRRLIYRYSIKDILENFDINMDDMNTFILDGNGKIVYHTNPIIYLKKFEVKNYDFYKKNEENVSGFFPFPSLSGESAENYLYLFRKFDQEIILGVSIDKDVILSYFRKIYFQIAIIMLSYLFIIYLIAKYLSNYISKPILLLSKFSAYILEDKESDIDLSQLPKNELKTLGENMIESFKKIKSLKDELHKTILSIGDGVIITDKDGIIKIFNKISEDITGYSSQDAIGKHISEVINITNEATGEILENPLLLAIKENKKFELSNHTILTRKNGEKRIVSDSATPLVVDGEIKGGVFIFRDDTEREKFKREMIRKQQIETIGIVAAGIAHDFNNILSAIYNYMSISKIDSIENTNIINFSEQVMNLCDKGKFLSNRLLILSKGGERINLNNINLYKLISDTLKFVLAGSSIKFNIIKLDEDACCIVADENLISQVLHNIILNARQALSDSGVITITISIENLKENDNKPYIKISIRDNGPGIPEEHIDRIFEPFFTTKDNGSGLGLYIAKSIIEKHDGFIKVLTEQDKGTEFLIYLPFTKKCALPEQKNVLLNEHVDLNVIVMDDDFFLRDSLSMLLETVGCKVHQAENGDEAYNIYEKSIKEGKKIDILFLDVTVPDGKGAKYTLEKIKKLDTDPKAIVMSGYTDSDIMENYKNYGFINILPKPFKKEDITKIFIDYKKSTIKN